MSFILRHGLNIDKCGVLCSYP